MIKYEYRKSKTVDSANFQNQGMKVNSLVEKRRFIYYSRGNQGTQDEICGSQKSKVRKRLVTWNATGEKCKISGAPIFIILSK